MTRFAIFFFISDVVFNIFLTKGLDIVYGKLKTLKKPTTREEDFRNIYDQVKVRKQNLEKQHKTCKIRDEDLLVFFIKFWTKFQEITLSRLKTSNFPHF